MTVNTIIHNPAQPYEIDCGAFNVHCDIAKRTTHPEIVAIANVKTVSISLSVFKLFINNNDLNMANAPIIANVLEIIMVLISIFPLKLSE